MGRFEARFLVATEAGLEQGFDGAEQGGFVGADEGDGFAAGAGAAGATDAVDVVFGDDGQVVIDRFRSSDAVFGLASLTGLRRPVAVPLSSMLMVGVGCAS